jgi:hypothetical protein
MKVLGIGVSLVAVLLGFAGVAAADVITATADTFLGEWDGATNHGSDPNLKISPGGENIALVYFDISGVSGAHIDSAYLNLASYGPYTAATFTVDRVTTAWVESEATYTNATNSVSWTTEGGDYVTAGEATGTRTATNTDQYWSATAGGAIDISAIVQYWKDNPGTNYGIRIVSDTSLNLDSREYYNQYNNSPPLTGYFPPLLTIASSGGSAPVPEPATLLLVGTGALGVFGYIRRRRMS